VGWLLPRAGCQGFTALLFACEWNDTIVCRKLIEAGADITKAVDAAKQKLLVSCRLKDVLCDPSGEKLAADRKAMTYTFLYRDAKKTLTAAEVDAAHKTVLDALAKGVQSLNFR